MQFFAQLFGLSLSDGSLQVDPITLVFVLLLLGLFFYALLSLQAQVNKVSKEVQRIDPQKPRITEQAHPSLSKGWSSYEKYFFHDPIEDQPKTRELAASFFTLEASLSPKLNLAAIRNTPNVLIGLGILGTFLGLAWGIGGFDTSSTLKIQDSISQLLKGMSTAFVSSLWGMGLSILFSLVEKQQLHKLSQQLADLAARLDRAYLTSEAQASDPASQLQAQLAPVLAELKQEKREGISQLIQEVSAKLEQSLAQTQGNFNKQLEANTQGEIQRFTQQMGSLSETLLALPEKFKAVQQAVQQSLDQQSQVQSKQLDQLQQLSYSLSNHLQRSEQVQQQLDRALDTLLEVPTQLQSLSQQLAQQGTQMGAVSGQVEEALQKLQRFHLERSSQEADWLRELEQRMQQSQTVSENYVKQFQQIDQSLVAIFTQLEKGLQQYRQETDQALSSYLSQFMETMAQSQENLSDSVQGLHNIVEELKELISGSQMNRF